jgi:hypothetical protein
MSAAMNDTEEIALVNAMSGVWRRRDTCLMSS